MSEQVKCPVCGENATRNKRGQLLIHTRTVYTGRYGAKSSEVCPGSTKGARP